MGKVEESGLTPQGEARLVAAIMKVRPTADMPKYPKRKSNPTAKKPAKRAS